jgi:drug/metabolite transporter (DMT)-like permease
MQISNYFIAILLCIGAILTAVFSSIYDEKKNKKMIAGIVVGVLLYAAGLGFAGMNSKVAAGMLAVGSILLAICSYFYNKKICDKETSTVQKRGLVAGIIVGVLMLIIGVLVAQPPFTIEQLTEKIEQVKTAAQEAARTAAAQVIVEPNQVAPA